MAYQSLYRRYRPRRFGEIVGQQPVVTGLRNAVREGRTGHAYLFSGPRGTGKTSIARILAKALNCTDLQDGEPCGRCESCVAIDAGTSYDLHELDAASNNGVEAMRDLINKTAIGSPGRSKVYILDEVHMLSTAASNALLKTLEEPPAHVAFVLATTDPQRVLPTIRSRCQHFEFGLIAAADLEAHVRSVAADAGIDLDQASVAYVVRKGAGSARDTLSVLEQVAALGGIPEDGEPLDELIDTLVERDSGRALSAVAHLLGNGREPRLIGEQVLARLRDAFLLTMGAPAPLLPDGELERITRVGRALGPAGLTRALEALGDALVEMRQAPDARVPLEVALIRLTRPELDTSVAALVERVVQLERKLAAVGSAPAAAPTASPEVTPSGEPAVVPTTATAPTAGLPSPVGGPLGGPAGEARRRVQARNGPVAPPSGAPSRPQAPSQPSPPPPAPAQGGAQGGAAQGGAAAGGAAREPAAADTDAPLPPIEELARAWSEIVLDALAPAAKARYRAGRFLALEDGVAVYGLPNSIHRDRCDEKRPDVEAALARHFGRPIPLRLIVDDTAGSVPPGGAPPPFGPTNGPDQQGSPPAGATVTRGRPDGDLPAGRSASGSASGSAGAGDGDPDHDPDIDVDDLHALPDATDVVATVVDRLMQAFPGSQVVE